MSKVPSRIARLSAASSAIMLMTGVAAAQSTPADNADDSGLQEIVVTAQKREESLQKVPIAVSAVTGASIQNQHIDDVRGLTGIVPNVQIQQFPNAPTAVFFIRGIGVTDSDPFVGTAVATVIDGVVQGVNTLGLTTMFDVDRIEVLRGPQGTLFGANTTGGVVNIVTRQPTGEFGLRGRVTAGNYGEFDQQIALDTPIIPEKLAGKLMVAHIQRDGFFTNTRDGTDLGNINQAAIRGFLRYTPSENFDATLRLEYDRARDGTRPIVNRAIPGMLLYYPPGFQKIDFRTYSDSPDVNNSDQYSATLTMNLASPVGDLTSITNYTDFKYKSWQDNDATPIHGLEGPRNTSHWQFTQELRDEISFSDSLRVQVGGFFLSEYYNVFQDLLRDALVKGGRSETQQIQHHRATSAFVQGYWNITEALQVMAGLRYTHDFVDAHNTVANYVNPTGGLPISGQGVFTDGFEASGKKGWDQLGGKIGVNYQIDPSKLLYAYYAHGFKTGGFNGRIATPAAIGPFNPEKVDTYEGGIKAGWFDNRVRTNIALFYNSYNDMQVAQRRFIGTTAVSLILNAAKATTKGVEVETEIVPTRGLTLRGSVGYLDAKYKNFDNNGVSFDGQPVQGAPKWSLGGGMSYRFDVGPGEVTIAGQANYVSKYCYNFTCIKPYEVINARTLVDANIDWKPTGANWSFNFWARNLFNKKYFASSSYNALYINANYGNPRQYGVDLNFEF